MAALERPASDARDGGIDRFAALLGIEVEVTGVGRALAAARVGEEHVNQHGTAHGAFLYALADAAFAAASNSRGERAVALATAFHHTTPARVGEALVAEAQEEHVGRRTALYRVAVRSRREGRLVALFTGTVFRQDAANPENRPEGERGGDSSPRRLS